MSREQNRLLELLAELFDGDLSKDQAAELNRILKEDPNARKIYRDHAELHARLHLDYASDSLPDAMPGKEPVKRDFSVRKWLLPLVAVMAISLFLTFLLRSEREVATLVSSENAAWESDLPTSQGSRLPAGELNLKTGLATLKFRSGAEITLEAPAQIVLVDSMRANLLHGSALLDVPKSAKGFLLDTPNGFAIDHGTSFAVKVGDDSSFQVLDGEISVHLPGDENSVRLTDKEAARVSKNLIEKDVSTAEEKTLEQPNGVVRVGTRGRSTSIIRNNSFPHLHPDFLMVKLEDNKNVYERRSLTGFDLSTIDLEKIDSIRLRLNLVPCGLGYAAHLPKVNRFAIYGLPEANDDNWHPGCLWEEAPGLENAAMLGAFEIQRSRQTGSFGIETAALLDFVKNDEDRKITLVLLRESAESRVGGLVHAFASDSHPEASGPILELKKSISE